MSRLTLSEIEVDENTFEPKKSVLVDGEKTGCSLVLEAIREFNSYHNNDDFKDELSNVIFQELEDYNVTKEEVFDFVNFHVSRSSSG